MHASLSLSLQGYEGDTFEFRTKRVKRVLLLIVATIGQLSLLRSFYIHTFQITLPAFSTSQRVLYTIKPCHEGALSRELAFNVI